MKKSNLLAIGLAGAFLLTSGVTAFADDDETTVKPGTPGDVAGEVASWGSTTVKIVDQTDPFDPTNPNQNELKLIRTPDEYHFETSLNSKGAYTLTEGNVANEFEVYNNASQRNWEVRVHSGDLTLTPGEYLPVSSFKINGVETRETGANPVVKNVDNTVNNNTGFMVTPVTELSLEFKDPNNQLKIDDELLGLVEYQLYYAGDVK